MKNPTYSAVLSLPVIMLAFFLTTTISCRKDTLFEQPTVEVTGYSLLELPGEYTHLEIDLKITNNDTREADIADIEYQVVIEGLSAEPENVDVNKTITVDQPLELSLPLTLITSDAIRILTMLDAGESLDYAVTGTFHIDDPILKLFDLPINVQGTASVEAGFESFYEQPDVNVTEISGSMNDDGNNGYVFEFDVTCLLKNNDSRSVTIDEVEYVVYIEGIESEQHNYSDYYSTDLVVAGDGESTVNLPLTLTLDAANGALLATAIQDGDIDFVVEGTFHVKELEGNSTDFSLPLYIEGSVDASIMGDLFQQPTIKITGYSLQELPGDSTYLEIDMLVTNNDNREVYIKDIEYLAVIEGIEAREEKEEIGKTILVGTPLELTLPLTLFTQDAIQLLTMLDAGESLDYVVTGIFHVDEPVLNMFELPIDISGSATVETGFEEFYEQPDIVVNDIEGSYSINGITSYTFNLDVNCTVTNQDSRAVEIDEVEYVVTVEGVRSSEHLYSDAYDTNIQISGGEAIDLTLPVTLNLGISSGASLAGALLDGTASYIIEGTFHAILVDGTAVDFKLPLYDTGSVPVTMIGK